MKTILFLAANPDDTSALSLNRELRDIQEEELLKSKFRDSFKPIRRDAVRWSDIERAILEEKPRIVHFCGHGAGQSGLVIEDNEGQPFLLSTSVLTDLFKQFSDTVECVLINACYSKEQAIALKDHINYVVGMNTAIGDETAIAYARGFYRALGAGCTIPNAHSAGCRAIQVKETAQTQVRDIGQEDESNELETIPLIPELWQKDKPMPFPDSLSQEVQAGLGVLERLLPIPSVGQAVMLFRTNFSAICEQIGVLKFYKSLHDLLHKVELTYYRNIIQNARNFPDDEIDLAILYEYEVALRGAIQEAEQIVAQQHEIGYDSAWILKLANACDEFKGAIAELDKRRLQKTIFLLAQLLADQPIRLNISLTSTARVLRLPDLVENLDQLSLEINPSITETTEIPQFKEGILSLEQLSEKLDHLIQTHDQWQDIDAILRRIETNLNRDTEELEWSWTDIKEKARLLCCDPSNPNIASLLQSEQELDQALSLQDDSKIRLHFSCYRRAALNEFSQVDLNLVRFCDELQKIGYSLALIVEKIS
jgi:hypothetical protein